MKRWLLLLFLPALLAIGLIAAACGDDEEEAVATPTEAATEEATAAPTEVATEVTDTKAALIAQFPADVQNLLQDLPENLIQLLLEVRNEGPGTVLWADAGGEFHEGQRRAAHAEWEQITGWTLQAASYPTVDALALLRTFAAEPEFDIFEAADAGTVEELCATEGLVYQLDLDLFPIDQLDPNKLQYDPAGCWVSLIYYGINVVYNTDVFGEPGSPGAPDSNLDIFDLENFPGKRCLFGFTQWSGNLETALLADGVPFDQVYDLLSTPEGLDRAFAKLDTIKDEVIFTESGAESVQFVIDGQCDMSITWNGRPFLRLLDEPDLPIAIIWKDAIYAVDPFVVMAKAPEPKAAASALAYAMQSRNQCDMFNEVGYGNPMAVAPFPDCLTEFALANGAIGENVNTLAAGVQRDDFFYQNRDIVPEAFTAWQTE